MSFTSEKILDKLDKDQYVSRPQRGKLDYRSSTKYQPILNCLCLAMGRGLRYVYIHTPPFWFAICHTFLVLVFIQVEKQKTTIEDWIITIFQLSRKKRLGMFASEEVLGT